MKWWFFLLLSILLSSCSSHGLKGIQCFKKRSYKSKSYRVKKLKPVLRPVYSASTSSEPSNSTLPTTTDDDTSAQENNDEPSEETASTIEAIEPELDVMVLATDLEVPTIEVQESPPKQSVPNTRPQTKRVTTRTRVTTNRSTDESNSSNTVVEQQETINELVAKPTVAVQEIEGSTPIVTLGDERPSFIVRFRDQDIDIRETYSFNELIPFVINQDELLNPNEAYEKIKDLSELLQENPQVKVTIIANTATDEPHPAHRYGGDEETLTYMYEKPKDSLTVEEDLYTLKDLMVARANRIEELLIEHGVTAEQLTYQLGTHNMWKYQRYVTFILNDEE